jgi:four helix bundle protein
MHKVNDLKVWQKAIELTVEIYKATGNFPREEQYGLTSQMRRCAVSIPSNIAEGAGRNTPGEFNQFLGYSTGSSYELMTQVIVANRLFFISNQTTEPILAKLQEIQKMTYNLKKAILL